MNNEIIRDEEIMETVEEISTVGSGKGLKALAAIGGIALAGVLVWKGGKWVKAKLANRKSKQEEVEEPDCTDVDEDVED